MFSQEQIKENYFQIKEKIKQIQKHPIEIIAVTKTFEPDIYDVCNGLNVTSVGENRTQELKDKIQKIKENHYDLKIHFIGNLQSKKVKYIKENIFSFDALHSIDLLNKIEYYWERNDISAINILIQINSTLEEQKSGIPYTQVQELYRFVERCQESSFVNLQGFMTMGPTPSVEMNMSYNQEKYFDAIRKSFSQTYSLLKKTEQELGISLPRLSMGMSQDYLIAIEEGATEIRIGSVLFGPRILPVK